MVAWFAMAVTVLSHVTGWLDERWLVQCMSNVCGMKTWMWLLGLPWLSQC